MAHDYKAVRDAVRSLCEKLLLPSTARGRRQEKAEEFVLKSVLHTLVWKHSEASPIAKGGKYLRCEWWSKNAHKRWRKNSKTRLIFEHVVPRKEIILRLMEAQNKKEISAALNMILTCVVLPEEDKNLRDIDKQRKQHGDRKEDWWKRYKEANIEWEGNPKLQFKASGIPDVYRDQRVTGTVVAPSKQGLG